MIFSSEEMYRLAFRYFTTTPSDVIPNITSLCREKGEVAMRNSEEAGYVVEGERETDVSFMLFCNSYFSDQIRVELPIS